MKWARNRTLRILPILANISPLLFPPQIFFKELLTTAFFFNYIQMLLVSRSAYKWFLHRPSSYNAAITLPMTWLPDTPWKSTHRRTSLSRPHSDSSSFVACWFKRFWLLNKSSLSSLDLADMVWDQHLLTAVSTAVVVTRVPRPVAKACIATIKGQRRFRRHRR